MRQIKEHEAEAQVREVGDNTILRSGGASASARRRRRQQAMVRAAVQLSNHRYGNADTDDLSSNLHFSWPLLVGKLYPCLSIPLSLSLSTHLCFSLDPSLDRSLIGFSLDPWLDLGLGSP